MDGDGAGTREKQGRVWVKPSSSESLAEGSNAALVCAPAAAGAGNGAGGGDAGRAGMWPAEGGTGSPKVSELLQESQH